MPASATSRVRREVSEMEATLSDTYVTLADAFAYPAPGRLEALKRGGATLPKGAGHDA